MQQRLKIAIQKSGRLSEKSRELLEECGIKIKKGKNKLIAPAINFPLDILYLRDDDIPQYVEDGTADIGVVGENVVLEENKEVKVIEPLGFGKCRLSLAVPKGATYTGVSFFQNKKIATSYPQILGSYLQERGVKAEIHKLSGSVEIAPGIGLADGIADLVSTGGTLFSNGLKEVEVILKSQAVLIATQQLEEAKKQILERLLFRVASVQKARNNKYILLNAPNESLEKIKQILPGMKSPTIMPLAIEGWSSVHSVIKEDEFWEVIEQLREAGGQGILVIPIEKMIL